MSTYDTEWNELEQRQRDEMWARRAQRKRDAETARQLDLDQRSEINRLHARVAELTASLKTTDANWSNAAQERDAALDRVAELKGLLDYSASEIMRLDRERNEVSYDLKKAQATISHAVEELRKALEVDDSTAFDDWVREVFEYLKTYMEEALPARIAEDGEPICGL